MLLSNSNLHVSTMQPAPALKYTSYTNSYIRSPASKHDTSCGSLLSSLTRLGCDWNTLCVCHLCQHQLCHNTVNYLLLEDSMQWHAHCVFPHDGTTAFIRDLFLGTTWKSHLLCDASRTKFPHPFSTGWMLT